MEMRRDASLEHGLKVVWVSQCISILSPRIDIFVMGQCIWLGMEEA